jgi:hypothetical protein
MWGERSPGLNCGKLKKIGTYNGRHVSTTNPWALTDELAPGKDWTLSDLIMHLAYEPRHLALRNRSIFPRRKP